MHFTVESFYLALVNVRPRPQGRVPSEVLADEQAARRLAGPSRASLQLVRAKEAAAATANLPTAHLLSGSSLVVGNGPGTMPGDLPSVRWCFIICCSHSSTINVSCRFLNCLQLPWRKVSFVSTRFTCINMFALIDIYFALMSCASCIRRANPRSPRLIVCAALPKLCWLRYYIGTAASLVFLFYFCVRFLHSFLHAFHLKSPHKGSWFSRCFAPVE